MSFGALGRGKPFANSLQIDYRTGGNLRYYLGEEGRLLLVPDEIRKCVAFILYQAADGPKLAGTVFFVGIFPSDLEGGFAFAVTAKHVIEEVRRRSVDGKAYLRVNTRNGPAIPIATDIESWRFHPSDKSVDVAALPISPSPSNNLDLLLYPVSSFATEQVIAKEKIGIGDEVFLVGLFYGHLGKKRNIPIMRVGNIAAMPEELVDTDIGLIEAYLVEARSIGGLSGSPVFVHLGLVRVSEDGSLQYAELKKTPRGGPFYLLGLMHGHWDIPVSAVDSMVMDDVHNEAVNMGIAVVVPATKILEVLNQPEFADRMSKQLEKVRGRKLPTPDKG